MSVGIGDRGSVERTRASLRPVTGSLALHQKHVRYRDPVSRRLSDAPLEMREEITVFAGSCFRPITLDNIEQQYKKYCDIVVTSLTIAVRFDGRIEIGRVHGHHLYRVCTTLERLLALLDQDPGGLSSDDDEEEVFIAIAHAAGMTSASEA